MANMLPATKLDVEEEACTFATQLYCISILPMTLKVAIQLNLLEIISEAGPGVYLSSEEIAAHLPTNNPQAPFMVDRILRLLASYKICNFSLSTDDSGRITRSYAAAPVCKFLTKNEDGDSMASLILMTQERVYTDSWNYMKQAVLDGGIPFNRANGMSLYDYCGTDRMFSTMFNEGMRCHSSLVMKKILEDYRGFDDVEVLVDVGGGIGTSLRIIISKHPHLKGINFDLPFVTAEAPVTRGIEHVGGDMFSSVPNGDAIFMKVRSMVVDSPRTYHEVTRYLQEIAPDLRDRVELYDKRIPIFDEYNIEDEINNILSKRVPLSNGGSLVIEQTEALVSIDVNGGHGMLGQGTSQEKAVLDVNLAAAKQIARELRLRDIGGIIVVDFIDMADESNKRLVYEETKKAVERDGSLVRVSELSRHGLMEITRKRVRPSVTFMVTEPCTCCHATGRVEALDTSFSKIEHEICRLLAASDQKPDPENAKSWPRVVLRVDRQMCTYLTSGKRTKLAILSSSLKVWILLKVARGFSRGQFEVKHFTEDKLNDEHQVAIARLRPTEARTYIPNTKLTLFPVKKWRNRGK